MTSTGKSIYTVTIMAIGNQDFPEAKAISDSPPESEERHPAL